MGNLEIVDLITNENNNLTQTDAHASRCSES